MRGIPISVHSALEVIAAPAIMVAPFLLGFGPAATTIAVLLGVVLLGLALQLEVPSRSMPLRAHASFDYMLALAAVFGGLAVGVIAEEWNAAVFLAGIGVAMVALTASTRFTAPRSA
jgi:small basic protein